MGIEDSIIGVESGGNPNAQNPNSSASGLGQFLSATWLDTLAKHRPDIQGSREELLALRNDPDLSREMTAAYAADNAATLKGAGFDATPGNTYLAHFAGPQGAVKVLSADPNAPVASILGGGVVKANPFLKDMTAADLQAWAARKMGGSNPSGSAPAAPPAPAASASAPIQQAPPSGNGSGLLAQIMGQLGSIQAQAPQPVQQDLQQMQRQQGQATLATLNSMLAQIAQQQASPILPKQTPRRAPSVASLQAALQASGNRGLFLNRG